MVSTGLTNPKHFLLWQQDALICGHNDLEIRGIFTPANPIIN